MEIAREVADELAVGLQQARLLEQVRQHADELEALVGQRTEALRASEARFRAIFEQSALGISLVDAEGLILDSNPALQAMLGYTGGELRGLPFGRLSRPDDLAADLERFQELVSGRREAYRLETRYLHREGEVLWANLVVSAVHGPKGDFRFAVRLAQDVTQQRRIQEALVRSEKLAVAGKLSASLMHEINNPLQAVIGCLALARESAAGPEGVGRYLEVADEELQRLAAIANQLRDLHRPHQPVGRTPTDVNALIERLLALHAPRYRECGVEVDWQPAAGRPVVPAAPGQLEQVFLNLLLNAVEAMPGGGWLQIRVEASDTPPGARVHFLDSGPGIPGEILPHIFEPFYTTRDDGLGLGLFICHSIIQDHGGRIEVDSREGEGTTFRIWLPG
jgi:PAS domain S-box-containing protein